ncbi:Translocase [Sulfitobacter noctilucae]|uniref:hypothetical protein n=1 Tax=Sulfitobacter noctilucae TaxID=1342302 RepID=UPI00046A8301|nr:hypothetical protein [Sulfitobacter noctilucae]KIN65693.1 Translocase [Sulfitobacter noctilucae]
MVRTKEILTGVGALACAAGIGFFMQSSDTAQERYGETSAQINAAEGSILTASSTTDSLLDVQEITLTSAEFDTGIALPDPVDEVVTVAAPSSVLPEPVSPEATVAPACEVSASARPIAGAMVDLTLNASCLPNERVTVHHNGMIFTETTSDAGALEIKVPALSIDAVYILAFSNGEGAVAQTTVEELADYDRAVLQWKGNTGFQIHAREFGANYGSKGHIWSDAPGSIADAVSGASGVLTLHGDTSAPEPLLAEVYSFPKAYNDRAGNIALSVEAAVTQANCGLEIEAQSLEIGSKGQIKTQNLTLSVPECEAEGDFLVLNNLLQDLKVAGK